ncbi:MAG: hypothetical protein K6C08_07930 [Oscillospiraceae bacterium]|nr:hypothetical protein [Oscillospiraceae bacterium]
MLSTVFLAIVILTAVTVMMISAVAFIQDEKMFSSAPKEVQKLIRPRETELFYGARAIGWTLPVFSVLMIIGVLVIAAWDGIRRRLPPILANTIKWREPADFTSRIA